MVHSQRMCPVQGLGLSEVGHQRVRVQTNGRRPARQAAPTRPEPWGFM